jgi:hypothetical protein
MTTNTDFIALVQESHWAKGQQHQQEQTGIANNPGKKKSYFQYCYIALLNMRSFQLFKLLEM